jgi:hypothetical protein
MPLGTTASSWVDSGGAGGRLICCSLSHAHASGQVLRQDGAIYHNNQVQGRIAERMEEGDIIVRGGRAGVCVCVCVCVCVSPDAFPARFFDNRKGLTGGVPVVAAPAELHL